MGGLRGSLGSMFAPSGPAGSAQCRAERFSKAHLRLRDILLARSCYLIPPDGFTRNAGDIAPMPGVWTTRGFAAFRQGSFGDAGKNLYISRAGVLQRIHSFDLNGDGYVDLPFCNSQEHWETPPALRLSRSAGRGLTRWSCPPRARVAVSWRTSTGTATMTWCWACTTTAPGRISTPASTTVRRKGWRARRQAPARACVHGGRGR